MFEFGARMHYRHAVHQRGESGAANTFVLSSLQRFGTSAVANAALPLVLAAMRALLPDAVFAKRRDSIMQSLYELCDAGVWCDVPPLCEWLGSLLVRAVRAHTLTVRSDRMLWRRRRRATPTACSSPTARAA